MNDYRIAGIDVHKKMLAVVVAELTTAGELAFQRRQFDNTEAGIHPVRDRFAEGQVREAVMESTATAQYWKAVWLELEGQFRLHLAQAMSNRAPWGRKRDFADAERLVRRLIAGELVLSYVPTGSSGCGHAGTRETPGTTRPRAVSQRSGGISGGRCGSSYPAY